MHSIKNSPTLGEVKDRRSKAFSGWSRHSSLAYRVLQGISGYILAPVQGAVPMSCWPWSAYPVSNGVGNGRQIAFKGKSTLYTLMWALCRYILRRSLRATCYPFFRMRRNETPALTRYKSEAIQFIGPSSSSASFESATHIIYHVVRI
jgi:hypothetical protein